MFSATIFLTLGLFLMGCEAQTSQAACPSCYVSQNMSTFDIPMELLTLDEFRTHLLDRTLIEVYYGYNHTRPFLPWLGYERRYTALSDEVFLEEIEAFDMFLPADSCCIRRTFTIELLPLKDGTKVNRARFLTSSERRHFYWSSCPDKYIWIMKCWYEENRDYCLKRDFEMALLIPKQKDPLDNLPWVSVMTDLRRSTDVIFSTDDLYWAWTYADNVCCN